MVLKLKKRKSSCFNANRLVFGPSLSEKGAPAYKLGLRLEGRKQRSGGKKKRMFKPGSRGWVFVLQGFAG